jgi:hypothetical protein
MRLVMTLLVRDEEDILEANLAFHRSQGVDHFIVTDNRSTDATPSILARWREQGIVTVIEERQDDYAQHAWVTRMARLAATGYGADWVINNDADEFWLSSCGTLKEALASLPDSARAASIERSNCPALEGPEPFWDRLVWRDTQSRNPLGGPLGPKVAHRGDPAIEIEQGNHFVRLRGVRVVPVGAPIDILHFPCRSWPQFERKIRLGGAAYARNTTLPSFIGKTWRDLYQRLLAGSLREDYDTQNPLGSEHAAQVASGRLVRDERLKRILDELMKDRAPRA